MNTTVSVIVTTKNEELNIRACIESITSQSYRNIEIIVVDNKSSDATKSIAREYTKNVLDKGPERSAQRNYGASKAKGEYLLFLDADMVLEKDVIKECVTKAENEKKVALIIPEESFGVGYWAQCKALERSLYLGVDWIEAARFFCKEIFVKINGYDESLTGPEDYDLPQRIKEMYGSNSISRINAFILHNEGRLSLGKSMQKKFYYGKKMREYMSKRHNSAYFSKQSSILARYILFFSNPNKLFHNPIIGMGMLFMKTTEMAATFLGYLSSL